MKGREPRAVVVDMMVVDDRDSHNGLRLVEPPRGCIGTYFAWHVQYSTIEACVGRPGRACRDQRKVKPPCGPPFSVGGSGTSSNGPSG